MSNAALSVVSDSVETVLARHVVESPVARQITSWVVTVTPELAQSFLARNLQRNRDIKRRAITSYVSDMESKAWRLTGEPLIFNEDGFLIDGQHRCESCVQSGVPFVTVVITGIPRDATDTLGSSEVRKLEDILQMQGEDFPSVLAGALTLLNAHLHGAFIKGRVDRLTPHGMRQLLDQHPGLRSSITATDHPNIKQHLDHKLAAAFHYIANRADPETTRDFFSRLQGALDSGFGDPEYALAERCRHATQGTTKLSRPEKKGILVKAFAIRQASKTIQQLKFNPDKARKWPIIRGDKLNGILVPQES